MGIPVFRQRNFDNVIYMRERGRRLRASKICCSCGQRPVTTITLCASCKETQRAACKRWREERIAKGLCVNCGDPVSEMKRCSECRRVQREKRTG
jgi:hypothetical protein